MFIASKYEDIYPLKMKMVYEKIAHKKLPIEKIKALEMDILRVINYKIPAPTILDFLKFYLKQVLDIGSPKSHKNNKSNSDKKEANPEVTQSSNLKLLIEKMALYLAKMSLHDYELSGKKPSILAVGSLYVALKICE
jgi:protein involved in sex pheromone biosynthesis